MNKIILQGLILIVLFITSWSVLARVDWLTVFKIQRMSEKTEEKLGDMFWELFDETEHENKDAFVAHSIDSIVTRICERNHFDRKQIKAHVLDKDVVNAFALPGRHLVVFSGLITAADNQEELSGVICHELAHIRMGHVMKKLVKDVGLSALISMAGGKTGGEVMKKAGKVLSSTAFDRKLEREADLKAVDYMVKAGIKPEPFADFLFKLASGHESEQYISWISTHPESKERAEHILEYCKGKEGEYSAVLTTITWDALKGRLNDE